MLTLVEAISLAGDRRKQNDDAAGIHGGFAWVIDGATDLHETPISNAASDAAWIAGQLNAAFTAASGAIPASEESLRTIVRDAARDAAARFAEFGAPDARWMSPTASALIAAETPEGLFGLDLGDCRCFALDTTGGHSAGGAARQAEDEAQRAREAAEIAGAIPLLRHAATLDGLRAIRARHNQNGGYWVFGLQQECAHQARVWTLRLQRPAHVLFATDGFSALVDRYYAYDASSLVHAAIDRGLQDLGRVLRAIEASDAAGARHPRFKASDDATALLLRLH